MKYCRYCGKQMEDHEKCACPESQANDNKAKKKNALILAGIAVILVTALILISASISNVVVASKIDPF